MKSRQAKAKEKQNYRVEARTCSNCVYYRSDIFISGTWTDEKNKRCGIGDFVVKKTAVCDLWEEIK